MRAMRIAGLVLPVLLLPAIAAAQWSAPVACTGGAVPGFSSGVHAVFGVGAEAVSPLGVSIGADVSFVFGRDTSDARAVTSIVTAIAALRPLRGRTEPFIGLGAALTASDPGLVFTLGVDHWFSRRVGVRVDLRGLSIRDEAGFGWLRAGVTIR